MGPIVKHYHGIAPTLKKTVFSVESKPRKFRRHEYVVRIIFIRI